MSFITAQMARHLGAAGRIEETVDRAITVRPSSSALFCVDSADRYASYNERATGATTPYTFRITKNESLLNGFFTRIALTEIVFPYWIPNINSKTDMIAFSDNGGALTPLTIAAQGFYSPSALAAALEGALVIATGNAGLTVSYTNGVFVFNTNNADTISFARGNFASPGAKLNEFQLYDLLNLSGPGVNGQTVAATSLVSGVTRCRYTEYIDIVSAPLTYNQDLKDGSSDPIVRDMICRVYIEDETSNIIPVYKTVAPEGAVMTQDVAIPGTYPFTIYRKFPMPKQILWNNTSPLGNLVFEVYDDKGQILSSHQGAVYPDSTMPDWRLTLLVSEN
jgi:hypothetical protein